MQRLIPSLHLKAILALSFIALLIALFLPSRSVESTHAVLTLVLPADDTATASDSNENAVNETPAPPRENWHMETVQEGDNLSLIFKRAGISATTLHHILEAAEGNDLKRLDPGQVIELGYDQNNRLIGIRLRRDVLTTIEILRTVDDRFESTVHTVEPTIKPIVKFATITKTHSSLYLAGQSIAMSDRLIMEMAALFQWDISFALDLREGDHFVVLYEGLYVDDSLIREGEILAAHFTNMGQPFDAFRYEDPSGKVGYFDHAGVSLRKAFIRDPVHFSYVSSSFNLNFWYMEQHVNKT
ncbi:MAG: peptidase M23, partial [Arenicellales bacterium]